MPTVKRAEHATLPWNEAVIPDEYTAREIKSMFDNIAEGIDRIEAQTTKTNGRVAVLERWQSFLQGGMAVLAMLLVPVLIYAVTHWQ
jgi:hypothetical protein